MAVFASLCFTPPFTFSSNQTHNSLNFTQNHLINQFTTKPTKFKTRATGHDLLGDFGARDPFPAEIETGFSDRVGVFDTEHKILIPNVAAMSLAQQECTPISHFQKPMTEDEAKSLLRKLLKTRNDSAWDSEFICIYLWNVVGWRFVNEDGKQKLQCLWKLKDFESGVELINRIFNVIGSTGHFPTLHLEPPNQVRAELWSSSIGGLSMNDFIVAAKIDEIKTSDLVPRKRAWA